VIARFVKRELAPLPALRMVAGVAAAVAAALVLGGCGRSDAQGESAPPQTQTPAQAPKTTPPASEADVRNQGSYSIGVSIGNQLKSLGLTPDALDLSRVTQGLKDALAGTAQVSAEDNQRVGALIESGRNATGNTNKAAATKFLAENGKRKGVVTTASGLQYRVVNAGKGTSPKATDQVTVHYRGTLLDGTEFDSSIKRGEPAQFPVNGVIKGWQEALVLMKPGAKWELFIPPDLAYGMDSPPSIPPNSLLRFDVELLSVGGEQAKGPGTAKPEGHP
jgi:FKBP-type peptidyl-prolyl cis-trans isomerase